MEALFKSVTSGSRPQSAVEWKRKPHVIKKSSVLLKFEIFLLSIDFTIGDAVSIKIEKKPRLV